MMTDALNKTIVNDTFNRAYNKEQFKLFIKDLLIDADFENAHEIKLPDDYKDFIKSAKRICKYMVDFVVNCSDNTITIRQSTDFKGALPATSTWTIDLTDFIQVFIETGNIKTILNHGTHGNATVWKKVDGLIKSALVVRRSVRGQFPFVDVRHVGVESCYHGILMYIIPLGIPSRTANHIKATYFRMFSNIWIESIRFFGLMMIFR